MISNRTFTVSMRSLVLPFMLLAGLSAQDSHAWEVIGCYYEAPLLACTAPERPMAVANCARESAGDAPEGHTPLMEPSNWICAPSTGEAEDPVEPVPAEPVVPAAVEVVAAPVVPSPPPESSCTSDSTTHIRRATRYERRFTASCEAHTADQIVASGGGATPACTGDAGTIVNAPFCAPACADDQSASSPACYRAARDEFYTNAADGTAAAQARIRTEFLESIQPGSPFDESFQQFKTSIEAMDARLSARPGPRSGWPQWLKDMRTHVERAKRRIRLFERHLTRLRDSEAPLTLSRIDAFAQQVNLLRSGCTYGLEGEADAGRCARTPGGGRETREKGNTTFFAIHNPPEGSDEADTGPAGELTNASAALDQFLGDRGAQTFDRDSLQGRLAEFRMTRECHSFKTRAAHERYLARRRTCRSTSVSDNDESGAETPNPSDPPAPAEDTEAPPAQ